ncbi:phosphoglucosamine mutase [Pantoea sp. SoEX]|uniref:phosphoglucosamine mutase n=1 Tax=Pantoea sp. SoEX TaxID=2576763 RepID=UPI00135CE82B|nr:phosphoglucosamine mutase [Pantoea sp. SoEX]MXP51096.1 phosphoglucosamine mutase [Pantoea sp. SoEX]
MGDLKYFGTDGIRGKVGELPITPDFVLKLGWAAGKVFTRQGSKKIIIGKDTRISGYMLESALEAGLSAAGLSVAFTGPMPTPAIAYLTRTFRAEAGIVISASHNPYDDNGIKFFSSKGTKLPNHIEKSIELEMEKKITCVEPSQLGRASRIVDASGRYIEFCKGTFPSNLNLNGIKIVVDCANGSTYHIAPNVLRELGAEVVPIAVKPNGVNINKECGTSHGYMLQRVLSEKADIGLSYDGDGDRIMMIDHLGSKVDGDQIIYIIAKEGLRHGNLHGGVVGTLMSNMGLEIALNQLGVAFERTKVGDRYVIEKMNKKGWRLGAENSGHIIILDKTTTCDGIVASLQVLSAMISNQMSLHDLCTGINMLPQILVNIHLPDNKNLLEKNKNPLENNEVIKLFQKIEKELSGCGRVLLRKSGTEPFIRVMVEGKDKEQIKKLSDLLVNQIKLTINII